MKHLIALAAALLALALFSACDHDKDGALRWHSGGNGSDSSSHNDDFVGSWSLSNAETTWYIHFAKDGTWFISDEKNSNSRHVYGTYTTDGTSFSGPMVNPHVGTGSIAGKIDGDLISLDFVEDWHTPPKHTAYTGEKL